MKTARRTYLRDLMNLAWGLLRSDPSRGFADALRGAWSWTKGRAARIANAPRWAKAGRPVSLSLGSMVQSPIRRSLTGPYAGDRARTTGRVTSIMGR